MAVSSIFSLHIITLALIFPDIRKIIVVSLAPFFPNIGIYVFIFISSFQSSWNPVNKRSQMKALSSQS